MITLEQAKNLKPGDYIYCKNSKTGKPMRYKVNGIPQVWKRSPERVRVPLKHGLYVYEQLTEQYLDKVFMSESEVK